MRNPRALCALTLTACSILSGCGDLTIGPKVETRYVIVEPGNPIVVLENVTVRGRTLKDEGQVVRQDIGGWVAMPASHWSVVKERLETHK